jgi:hypothetical protein
MVSFARGEEGRLETISSGFLSRRLVDIDELIGLISYNVVWRPCEPCVCERRVAGALRSDAAVCAD